MRLGMAPITGPCRAAARPLNQRARLVLLSRVPFPCRPSEQDIIQDINNVLIFPTNVHGCGYE